MRDLWALAVLFVLAAGSLPSSHHTGVEVDETEAPAVVHSGANALQLNTSVVEKILSNAVTVIYSSQEHEMGMGSGILYSKNGKWYVMTAAHVVADEKTYGCGKILVMFTPYDSDMSTHSWIGKLAACNEKMDAAIIELDGTGEKEMAGATFMRDTPKVGQGVYAVGNPAGDINTVTEGIVCHNRRRVDWCETRHLQITCNGAHGSSGGGVYSADTGECLGIVVRLNSESRILMILPTNRVIEWMHSNNLSDIAPY